MDRECLSPDHAEEHLWDCFMEKLDEIIDDLAYSACLPPGEGTHSASRANELIENIRRIEKAAKLLEVEASFQDNIDYVMHRAILFKKSIGRRKSGN